MDPLPIEVSRKTIVLASTTIAVSLVVLSTVTFNLFLAGLRARERDLLLDEIQDVQSGFAERWMRERHGILRRHVPWAAWLPVWSTRSAIRFMPCG